ncbi:MAG: TolC family protein, partial [Phyllobacteriaceae bacterium]|nr:TolC family protein [Phyllobacteriaceae bacterium]
MLRRSSNSCRTALLSALFTTALTGCAGIVPADTPVSAPKDAATFATDHSLPGSPKGRWPSDGWWTGYGDRQLSGLVEEGLADASDIAAAKARLQRARAAVGVSRSTLLPSVGASGKVDQERQSYNYLIAEQVVPHGWNDAGLVFVDATWEIDFWGKNRAALAAATSEAAAAEAEAAATRLLLSSAIASG